MAEPRASGNRDRADQRPAAPESPTPDLPSLLAAARRGEADAWASLVSIYARRVYAFARSKRLREDEAEEVAQSVFATVSIKVQQGAYDERGSFEAWLFQIAANRVRDALRKSRRAHAAMDAFRDSADAPGRSHADAEPTDDAEIDGLRRALADLPEPDREIIGLRHHAGMSFKHIAAMLGVPVGTALARHHRALKKLRDSLEPGDNTPDETNP
ncbi:MAG: RNA polymerase sigma factor [Phycisphaerales bacterium]